MIKHRIEPDLLGDQAVPINALYGGQTARAVINFPITKVFISRFPHLINSLAMVKLAAARANEKTGVLSTEKKNLIETICLEIMEGKWHDQFVVDIFQGGAGTSTNMNMNEVIANRASQIMGKPLGCYQVLHPNNDVNLSQSTNDAYPTAVRLSVLLDSCRLLDALKSLCKSLRIKSKQFALVMKLGRTQLQDAVPISLGQTFSAYEATLREEKKRIEDELSLFHEINLGGTAVGTGINTHFSYSSLAISGLAEISKQPLVAASDLIEATSDMGAFVAFSGSLKRTAIKLSRISNDLRLMNSGPRGGLNEINLPARQPGSSIMPGKVNPVIPEVVNQIAFQIIGKDVTVSMAAEAGQLELNVMEPVIAYNVLDSVDLLFSAIDLLDRFCIRGITANEERCRFLLEQSIVIVTALNGKLGYKTANSIAKEALKTGKTVKGIVLARKLMSEEDVDSYLDINRMLRPQAEL